MDDHQQNLKTNRLLCAAMAMTALVEQTAIHSHSRPDGAWPEDWAIADPDEYQTWRELKTAVQAFNQPQPEPAT